MITAALFQRRAERFASLLDDTTTAGPGPVRAGLDRRLARLVSLGRRLPGADPPVALDPDFRAGLRAVLVATAEREGVGATTRPAAGPRSAAGHRPLRWAIVIGVVIGAGAVSGLSTASDSLRTGVDSAQRDERADERSSEPVRHGERYLASAPSRLAEAAAVRDDERAFAAVLHRMDAETRLGVALLTATAVGQHDQAALDVIDRFVHEHRTRVAALLVGLPPSQRSYVLASLALLDRVDKRVAELRPAVACATPLVMERDEFGLVPHGCA